ncbi:hypothetical protein EXIGLDRAFT_784291 [Exidia glandulosa HHB12029]|uniref:Uncharacterized protein n=1 Tax=Exidia glandulosa HHB12029 TaxID=1314781 RepID=A0A166MJT8_EXIGL|nr:hypothetical protein EXIGLDRAFT_784291 [Exidia glandulosa HHB12029]
MKFNSIAALVLASVAIVLADACMRGGVYCGVSLLRLGNNHHDHIVQVLEVNGQPTDVQHIDDSLFNRLSGGDTRYREFCANGCERTDSDDPDFCF